MTVTGQESAPVVFDAGPQMVSVGPEPHQEVNLETAERMLTALAVRSPKVFGELLRDAILGEP